MRLRDMMLGGLVAVIWGFNFVVIDAGMRGVPPLLFAAVRFAAVGLLACVVPRPACSWRAIVLVGLTMSAGHFGFLYLALAAGMPPGLASLLLQVQVPLTVVCAAVLFREPISARKALGIAVALVGLAIVALGRGEAVTAAALGLTLLGALSWAMGNVAARKAGAGGFRMVVWSSLVVPVPLLGASAVVDGPGAWGTAFAGWGLAQTLSTAFTVLVSTLLAFGLWNGLLARYPASSVAPFALLVPVFGFLGGFLFQHTVPGPWALLGGAVLLAGAAVAILAPTRAPTPPAPASPPASSP